MHTVSKTNQGFTLLEIMLVLLILGLAAGSVVFQFNPNDPDKQLRHEAQRFQATFALASDWAVLNQQQLGLVINESAQRYHFARLDDNDQWQVFTTRPFDEYQLPEFFTLSLKLDDLPWEQAEDLFDRRLFDEESDLDNLGVNIGEEQAPPPPPQIFILSSGEFDHFQLQFAYLDSSGVASQYLVSGQGLLPLELTKEGQYAR